MDISLTSSDELRSKGSWEHLSYTNVNLVLPQLTKNFEFELRLFEKQALQVSILLALIIKSNSNHLKKNCIIHNFMKQLCFPPA